MRVVLAEDAAVLRDGLTELLDTYGHQVVAAVADADALLAVAADHRPDVAVVDIRMPPTHTDEGLRAAIELRRTYPRLGVLVFSQYIEARYATDLLAIRAGGVGYLVKERVTNVRSFMSALTRVAAGETVLDPDVVVQLVGANRHRDTLDRLTAREQEVLDLMAQGRSNTAIAQLLHISIGTVEKHVSAIFGKFDLAAADTDHRRVLAVLRYLKE
ncbi:response regulator [Couchioplanes caeruleus]|uniref:DNA-binding response regulator n=1 Tax=Couchioplanes caeruleus subsp. caeruleus TaxID=56427 RepID=A0A1K0GT57_9ACTN|nr:response regulator transcription factor [Couchioplanes caeruleus]OJF15630.1 DNA-binding response regulator [Couchioplanes caeruleus subsp. caeruleus]